MKQIQNTIIRPMTTEIISKISSVQINDIKQLQDPRMGSQTDRCGTCNEFSNRCVGHYGHIHLPFPVFVPLLQQQYNLLLDIICLNCLKIAIKHGAGDLMTQIRSLRQLRKSEIKCPHCSHVLETFQIETIARGNTDTKIPLHIKCTKFQAYNIKKILDGEDLIANGSDELVVLSPIYLNRVLNQLQTQPEARSLVQNTQSFECFMIQNIPVPPNSLRVLSQQTQSHAMNAVYGTIISSVQALSKIKLFVDDLYLAPLEKYPQIQYNRIIIGSRVVLYKDTSRNSKPQIKQLLLDLLSVSTQEPASALSQCLAKKGWFRQFISSARVGMSARTVVVGDPWLDVDQVVIPRFFGENLFMPVTVNNLNIEKLKGLIMNYPDYPCAMRRVFNKITFTITEENKQSQALQCSLGDVVMVQLMDNDIVLVQRYPTLREESFTAMRIKIEDTKAIKLPLSVIAKQGADFDGDEMEIFVLPSKSDCIEAAGCLSSCAQFVTYETGQNLIGATVKIQNVAPGIFHLQNENFKNKHFPEVTGKNNDEVVSGIQLIQKVFEDKIYIGELGKKQLSQLTYKDKNIEIKDGKFIKIETDLVGSDSQFLTFVQFHHGQYMAIKIIDEITHLSYKVNHVSASTLLNNMFLKKELREGLREVDTRRVQMLQGIIDDLYNGRIIPPIGFDLKMYFDKIYNSRLNDDEMEQQKKLLEYIKIPRVDFLNKYYEKDIVKVISAVTHLGQQLDNGQRITSDKYYKRTIVSFPKFQPTPQSEGYILGNFYDGLTQKEMFMHAAAARRENYIKGNTTAVGGYLARRLNQGAGNMFAKPNGIICTSGGQVVSLQYGSSGYGPRNYIVIKFDKHKIPMEEFDAQYGTHPRYEEMRQIREDIIANEGILRRNVPKYTGSDELVVPFKFDQETISEEELDNILTCRLCDKMSDGFKEIIISQAYMFYIYALFFLKVDNNSTYKIVDKYLQSLVQIGEPVGMKAGLACSQPYTQGMLSAIHTKSGIMTITQEEFTTGVTRFQELVTGNKGPTVVQFQLLGKAKYNIEKNIDFITKNQTIKFTNLKPQILIFQSPDRYAGYQEKIHKVVKNLETFEKSSYSKYMMKLTFSYKQLAYYIIDIDQMIKDIIADAPTQIKMVVPIDDDDNLVMLIYFDGNILKQQVSMIKNDMLNKLSLGPGLFYNLYFDPPADLKEGESYKIIANLSNPKHEISKDGLLRVYSIPGIDPATVYCSDPRQYYDYCGIVKTRLSLYTELHINLVSDNATKAVQGTHVRLICDLLTQSGELTSFTRNSYRKEGQRDLYSLLLFEQGDVFLANELQNPHLQIVNTSLNSCIFGTDAEQGTTVSQIMFNDGIKKQNQEALEDQM